MRTAPLDNMRGVGKRLAIGVVLIERHVTQYERVTRRSGRTRVMRKSALLIAMLFAHPAHAGEPFRLGLPVSCEIGKTCWVQQYPDHDPAPGFTDYMCGSQTYDGHDGTDIRVLDTTSLIDVIAAAPGTVKAVRDGVADHLMLTPEDRKTVGNRECGNGVVIAHDGGWETQYCHLRQGSLAVKSGDTVETGTRLGRVGYSGMAAFPHVHLTVRKDGKSLDPFSNTDDGTACGTTRNSLWTDEAGAALTYAMGQLLRTGFATRKVEIEALETGGLSDVAIGNDPPALVIYGWAINLAKDDVITLTLEGPGSIRAENSVKLDRPKAQYLLFTGKQRPAGGWTKGEYYGYIEVRNGTELRLSRSVAINLD